MRKNLIFLFLLISIFCFSQTNEVEIDSVYLTPIIDVSIPALHFDFNSSEFNNIEKLKKDCKIFIKYKVKRILLTGHCTKEEYLRNPQISKSRIEKIKSLMVEYGIEPKIIETKDYYAQQPKSCNGNNEIDQRVELIIME